MKSMRKLFALFLISVFILGTSFLARADSLNHAENVYGGEYITENIENTIGQTETENSGDFALRTGDPGIIIAFGAFVLTAFVTTKLTKNKNKS